MEPSASAPRRVIVMGAAGRDFHNHMIALAQDPGVEVVAFTATQIPGIDDRSLPTELAGERYPEGIPVLPEARLEELIGTLSAHEVIFAYSDVAHADLMHVASRVLACGADFRILGPRATMVRSSVPVISVCAVRTGVGKSGISRRVYERLAHHGLRVVDVRHPMPYRDLGAMRVERYASLADLDRLGVTIEEREEYEPLLEAGATVMAGVDYEAVCRAAEAEADVIIWDGGNNDWPFFASDLEIVALDPHRAGHERSYFPGEVNFLRADVLVVTKVDTAQPDQVELLVDSARLHNPGARIVKAALKIEADRPELLEGARVLAVEDGPTVTHGGMTYGAAALCAEQHGARSLIDPTPFAKGSIAQTLRSYPHLTRVLPAMGYSPAQLEDLRATIEASDADVVALGTPVDLGRIITLSKPAVRVRYRVEDAGAVTIDDVVDEFVHARGLAR